MGFFSSILEKSWQSTKVISLFTTPANIFTDNPIFATTKAYLVHSMPNTSSYHRPIRSFVLREGRFTNGQRSAYERSWPRYGIDYPEDTQLNLGDLFGNHNPVFLEIGFGNGEALVETATRHPEQNYIGIEVHRPGIGHLMLRTEEEGLSNIRIMRHDAVEVLRYSFLIPGINSGITSGAL